MIHDQIVKSLEDRLRVRDKYDKILSCKEYRVHGVFGECDLMAIRGYSAIVFEVKGRDKPKYRKKAYRQLSKDYDWVMDRHRYIERVFKFYVYARGSKINIERVN